jgi:UDP-glucose 4-epimerase
MSRVGLSSFSRILVTGGAGFIGSHIVDYLVEEGVEVTVLDNLWSGRLENIKHHIGEKGFRFLKGDITERERVKEALKDVDAVFHEAAIVSVDYSLEHPEATHRVNCDATLNLLKASLDSGIKRFIYASSIAVIGEAKDLPIKENHPTKPLSPYGVSKLAAENYCSLFHRLYGLETVSLRYMNVYGPRQIRNSYSGVITIFLNRLLKDEPPIIHGDGEQTRDFVNVRDVIQANMLALTKKEAAGEVFIIGSGKKVTINKLAELLLSITGKHACTPIHGKPRPGDIRHSYCDISKAEKVLGYHPKVSLSEGLSNLLDHILSSKGGLYL